MAAIVLFDDILENSHKPTLEKYSPFYNSLFVFKLEFQSKLKNVFSA